MPSVPSETEKAYMAGIIDGEGCIGTARSDRPLGKGVGVGLVSISPFLSQ